MIASRTEAGLTGAFIMVLFFAAIIVGFNVKAVPKGHSIQPNVVVAEVLPNKKEQCAELHKEMVALERCHERYNCTLFPGDFRRGIDLADTVERLQCEWEAEQSIEKGAGDLQASRGITRGRT
jgi:hypothetical protein